MELTPEEITQSEILIAEFMELKHMWKEYPNAQLNRLEVDRGSYWAEPKYHSSIDALRPVMDKICGLGYTIIWTQCERSYCQIFGTKRGVPYCGIIVKKNPFLAVADFIKCYKKVKAKAKKPKTTLP